MNWGHIDWAAVRFIFVFIFASFDFVAAGLVGFFLWRRRNGSTRLLSTAFIGYSFRGLGEIVGVCFGWQQAPIPTVTNAICYWSSRFVCAVCLWLLVHYILWGSSHKRNDIQ